MVEQLLLPDANCLCLDSVQIDEDTVVFETLSQQEIALCPCCGFLSVHVHSGYRRKPADVPLSGYAVQLALSGRRFFCDNPACDRRIPVFTRTGSSRNAGDLGTLGDKLRNWKKGFPDQVMRICCALHNFRLNFRPWNYDLQTTQSG